MQLPRPNDVAVTVLVIEDDPPIRRALRNLLGDRGVHVVDAGTGREGLDLAAISAPDLVVLDVGLPDMAGDVVCRELRAWTLVPILVLSARHSEQEKIRLLDAGADDYLTKPFAPGELLARVRAQTRRGRLTSPTAHAMPLQAGELTIDLHRRTVTRAGHLIHLTPIEWRILRTLVADAGRTLTHRQIFDAVWRQRHGDPQQYLRVHVTNLRRKIEVDTSEPVHVVTEPGVGYRFELPRDADRTA